MELKKNPKADLTRLRGLLLEIGLIVALLALICAATYTPREYRIEQAPIEYGPVEEQITEITRQDEKEPPPPPKKVEVKVLTDVLQVVTNDTVVEMEVDFAEFEEDLEIIQQIGTSDEVVEDDMPLLIAETMPSFQGGDIMTFRAWVGKQLVYPAIASENGISGTVMVTFVIERDGTLTNIETLMSPDRSLSEEAIRVLKTSPKWEPAMQRNQPVRLRFNLPINFSMH